MKTIQLFCALLTFVFLSTDHAHAQSQSCACAYFPVYQQSGDFWVYYGEQFIDIPDGSKCKDVTAIQGPVVCDINVCRDGNQECGNHFPCNTCMPLTTVISCAELKAMNLGLNAADIGPADGNILRDLPAQRPDAESGDMVPHRGSTTASPPRVIQIRTDSGDVFFAMIAILSNPNSDRDLAYGIEVSPPVVPPAVTTPIRVPIAPCRQGADIEFQAVQGLVVANVNGREYMIRVSQERTIAGMVNPLRVVSGVPFAQSGYTTPRVTPCCGGEDVDPPPATLPPVVNARTAAPTRSLRQSTSRLSSQIAALQRALKDIQTELNDLSKAIKEDQ